MCVLRPEKVAKSHVSKVRLALLRSPFSFTFVIPSLFSHISSNARSAHTQFVRAEAAHSRSRRFSLLQEEKKKKDDEDEICFFFSSSANPPLSVYDDLLPGRVRTKVCTLKPAVPTPGTIFTYTSTTQSNLARTISRAHT